MKRQDKFARHKSLLLWIILSLAGAPCAQVCYVISSYGYLKNQIDYNKLKVLFYGLTAVGRHVSLSPHARGSESINISQDYYLTEWLNSK